MCVCVLAGLRMCARLCEFRRGLGSTAIHVLVCGQNSLMFPVHLGMTCMVYTLLVD